MRADHFSQRQLFLGWIGAIHEGRSEPVYRIHPGALYDAAGATVFGRFEVDGTPDYSMVEALRIASISGWVRDASDPCQSDDEVLFLKWDKLYCISHTEWSTDLKLAQDYDGPFRCTVSAS